MPGSNRAATAAGLAGLAALLTLGGCTDRGQPLSPVRQEKSSAPRFANSATSTVVLDFEGLESFTWVDDRYAPQGVTFSGAQALNAADMSDAIPPRSGTGVVFDPSGFGGTITATFSSPVSGAGGYVTAFNPVILECHDAAGALLGADTLPAPNYAGAPSGIAPNAWLAVSAPGIARCTFRDAFGHADSYALDDFTFTPAVAQPLALTVTLDIRPGANPNTIGRSDRGVLPVALLTTPGFDAASADPATLTLGDETDPDTPPARRPNGTLMAALEDADGDGDLDLVLHFRLPELRANGDLTDTTTELTLRGQTRDGTPIRGTDTVRLVP